jgi:drug/metabolite transporter (DMT)-like permease
VPLLTGFTAILVLDERVTWSIFFGGLLILFGLFLSQGKMLNMAKIACRIGGSGKQSQ